MIKWTYQATTKKETGYEDMPKKFYIDPDKFAAMTDDEQNAIVADLIAWIRTKNHFPIYYFNEAGVKEEVNKVIKKNDVKVEDGKLVTQASLGLLLLDYLFPNLHAVNAGYYDRNMFVRWEDDAILAQCLKGYMKLYAINSMRTAFFQLARMLYATATNFAPIRAKAIYEYLAKPNATIYDFSCGFGGRMLGCLSSKNNYTYIGTEPNTETFIHLNELGDHIAAAKKGVKYKIYNECSENLILEPKSIDVAFSCPPFYMLERYCDEETQSVVKFPEYNEWLEGYVRPTIRNIFNALKDDGIMAVDILDFEYRNVKYHLVADWKRIAAEEGFQLKDSIQILSRSNARKNGDVNPDKLEQVYIFTKGE